MVLPYPSSSRSLSPPPVLTGQSSEGEHADLSCDVVPSAGGAQLHETVPQTLPHLDDAARHDADVVLPVGETRSGQVLH